MDYRCHIDFEPGGNIMKYKILVLLTLFVFYVPYNCGAEDLKLKNPAAATGYSLGATILLSIPTLISLYSSEKGELYVPVTSLALSLAGIIVGPSTGHFYAGNRRRAMSSIGFRSICVGVGALSLSTGAAYMFTNMDGDPTLFFMVAKASGIAIAGSALYDIFTCPLSVEKYNRSLLNQGGLYFSPEIDLNNESYGLSLSYRF
jgi:hypothetical protein